MLTDVKIESDGARATVTVGGVAVKGATRIAVEMTPNSLPLVTLDLVAFQNTMDLSGAVLKIGGIEAPEALERAMLAFLRAKYAPKHDLLKVDTLTAVGDLQPGILAVSPVVCGLDVGARDDTTSISTFAQGGLVEGGWYLVGETGHELSPAVRQPIAEDKAIRAQRVISITGSLPTAEEMAPHIRSVVQSVAADLMRLPVREMSAGMAIPADLTAHVDEAIASGKPQHHAISFPVASDRERRDGRTAWMPGAQ